MRIGIFCGDDNLGSMVDKAVQTEADGFDSFWVPQIFGIDALGALTLIGDKVPRIELGTAVVPIYARHPLTMASQALTASVASGGRVTLGIGLSHQLVVEAMWGMSFDKPVRQMREYLAALLPLLAGEDASFSGETVTARGKIQIDGAPPVPTLIAALGPAMLKLAAEQTTGTITWMTGPKTLADHTVPTLTKAAEAAGTGEMRVVTSLPVAVTDDVDAAKERCARVFSIYGQLPSYRAMLDREGAEGPADVALIGTEAQVRADIERLRSAGVTDFVASEFHGPGPIADATRALLRSLV